MSISWAVAERGAWAGLGWAFPGIACRVRISFEKDKLSSTYLTPNVTLGWAAGRWVL